VKSSATIARIDAQKSALFIFLQLLLIHFAANLRIKIENPNLLEKKQKTTKVSISRKEMPS
jgi:hypothetical protein